jgi:phage gpG-like protein
MYSLTVHITNLRGTEERLERIKLALKDMTLVMESLAAKLVLFYGDTVFASEGQALNGERWQELAPSTKAEKSRDWPGRGILEREGTMRRSYTSDITPTSLFITNSDPKFLFHQLGTGLGGGRSPFENKLGSLARAYSIGGMGRGRNIPARRMIGLNQNIESMIRKEVELEVRGKIDATKG